MKVGPLGVQQFLGPTSGSRQIASDGESFYLHTKYLPKPIEEGFPTTLG